MEKYLKLMDDIMQDGVYKPAAREGMPGSKSLFGYQIRYNLSEGFPLLTTKKMFWKGIVAELIWFLRGDTNIKFLIDNGSNFWTKDAYNYYRMRCENYKVAPMPMAEFVSIIRDNPDLAHSGIPGYNFGDCGYQYGKVWRNWTQPELDEEGDHTGNTVKVDQIKRVLNSLINAPQGRRHLVTAVDPINDNDLALYWCHSLFQFNARPLSKGERCLYAWSNNVDNLQGSMAFEDLEMIMTEWLDKQEIPIYALDCQMYQRSADTFLGVPFNIASYSLITLLFAKICNMIPGDFIHTFGDVHIYEDHYEAVHTQMDRTPYRLPTVKISDKVREAIVAGDTINQVLNSIDFCHFDLQDYEFHPAIKANLSTGTGK